MSAVVGVTGEPLKVVWNPNDAPHTVAPAADSVGDRLASSSNNNTTTAAADAGGDSSSSSSSTGSSDVETNAPQATDAGGVGGEGGGGKRERKLGVVGDGGVAPTGGSSRNRRRRALEEGGEDARLGPAGGFAGWATGEGVEGWLPEAGGAVVREREEGQGVGGGRPGEPSGRRGDMRR